MGIGHEGSSHGAAHGGHGVILAAWSCRSGQDASQGRRWGERLPARRFPSLLA